MDNDEKNTNNINMIVKRVISEINIGKSNIFKIVDNVSDEFQVKNEELQEVKREIEEVIGKVDKLQVLDKNMRLTLAEVSKISGEKAEKIMKKAYEEAIEIRVEYITKQNEEKNLKRRRNSLEKTLKNYLKNIEEADNTVNQINIALGYLEGDMANVEEDSQMLIGIKILESQERERKRIAREIHDGPAQYIANTMMRIDFCKMVVQKDLNKGLKELDDLKNNVRKALKEVRGILFDLRPLSLEERGLNEAIKDMVNEISIESNICVNVTLNTMNYEIEHIIEIAVYRIIQEILNNIKKHSKANEVSVRIECGKEYISFMVKDDGIGFNLKETMAKNKEKGTSYGLIGIFDRVTQLQGHIDIKSAHNRGTIYKIKLPINREVYKNERK
ncbi:sensor histidine kinase [Clostridium gasigenes]|uniref:sensor histidine kinase n=1 Tax=Clostridium gasigenes TaxID=94869 RepID=UPI00162746F9|nr:sensor histidine kinase [Clostridium gasigenes]MBB6622293.1 sensor histidine kinase [Clostridium gasigenes]MBU3087073.1 sensor histidine kinase [Clostridium gasigenes]